MANTSGGKGNQASLTTSPSAREYSNVQDRRIEETAAQKVARLKEENEALELELTNAKLRIALQATNKQLDSQA